MVDFIIVKIEKMIQREVRKLNQSQRRKKESGQIPLKKRRKSQQIESLRL